MSKAQPRSSTRLIPARRRGQAIVEFGLVALLFTLLLMGTVDFAILLNGWLGVSSSARDIARQAAVGLCPQPTYLPAPAPTGTCTASVLNLPAPTSLVIQGVDQCANAAAVSAQCPAINPPAARKAPISVTLYICSPSDLTTCNTPAYLGANLWNIYPGGSCDNTSVNCPHPVANDSIVVTVTAQIQVITPLARPFFGCLNGTTRCDVSITSRSVIRYEGIFVG